ncbi:MAG: aminotransferase class V-fold PLP-dependent enzyme, partial [Spirochaetia bacterium]
AGCSCAAPYGHRILHIDGRKSIELRRSIMRGNIGLKPGWVRLNFHFLLTDDEVDFISRAILFVAERGKQFLPLYRFDMQSGAWEHKTHHPSPAPFGLEAALGAARAPAVSAPAVGAPAADQKSPFSDYLAQAAALADRLTAQWSEAGMKSTEKDLIPFVYF